MTTNHDGWEPVTVLTPGSWAMADEMNSEREKRPMGHFIQAVATLIAMFSAKRDGRH